MSKIDLSIIIPSFNTKELILECIESIVKTAKKVSYEIIVVDNNSSDGSVEAIENLKQKTKNLKLILNKENVGFSKANNQGVKESSGRYLLFLNSDTVVYENALDGMVEFMDSNPKAGAATCYLEMPNGELDDASHRGFPTPWRSLTHFTGVSKLFKGSQILNGYHLGYKNLDKIHEIEACAGAFMIVRRVAGEAMKWWDEDFFWYGDDLDFCYRLKEKGWKIYFVPEYKILHYKGVSGGIKEISKHLTKADFSTRKKAMQSRYEAMRLFYEKHYKQKYPRIISEMIKSGIFLKKFSPF